MSLALVLALHSQAWAQTEGAAAPTLPAIVVKGQAPEATTEGNGSYTTGRAGTATPLGLSLRDTPQSVSVITQQRMQDEGLRTLLDVIDKAAVGLSVHRFETNRVNFISRGFKVTSLMVDGVPTIWDSTWTAGETMGSLALYDRVEVVRGATGLSSSTGEPSAAVNVVRKRANSKTLTGNAELGLGHWDQRRAAVDVSTPLNESGSVRARLVGEYEQRDSWLDLKKDTVGTLYATLSADLTPQTVLSAGLTRQDNGSDSPMWGGLPYWYADGGKTNWSRSKTTAPRWSRWDSKYEEAFADLEHRFDNGWSGRVRLSHSDRKGDTPLLYLSGAPDRTTGLGMGAFEAWYKNRTQQDSVGLSVNGPVQLAGRTHEASIGYAHTKRDFNADVAAGPGGAVGNLNTWDGTYPEPAWGARTFYQMDRTEQQALYGVVRLNLADPLRLILGARVTDYEKSGHAENGARLYRMSFDREVTPYAGATFDLNDTYSLYASYTDMFQPQQVRDINGRYLDPVVGKSMETGIKGEFLEGRLNASAAIFRIKQDRLGQATGQKVGGIVGGEDAYEESDGATSKGFELEVAGELRPGWSVSAGYTQFSLKDSSGQSFNTIYPRKLLRLFTAYQLPGAWNALTIGGGINWQSLTYTETLNPTATPDRIDQKSYALVNLMARYDINKQWTAQLNVSNLFDKTFYGLFDAYDQITYGEPRNITASLRYKF